MALKGHLLSGGLVGPLAGIETGSADTLGVFDGSGSAAATSLSAYLDSVIGDDQGTILYRDASAWAGLVPGTSGQVLKTQGASANPVWGDVASPVWELIETRTVNGVEDFTGLDGYQAIRLVLTGVATNVSTTFFVNVGTGATPTWLTSSGDYYWVDTSNGKKTDTAAMFFFSANSSGPFYGSLTINDFSLATPKETKGTSALPYSVATTTALTAVRFSPSGVVTVSGGTAYLLGLPGS